MTKKTQAEGRIKKNAFVHKLYTMLNDSKLNHLIWWTQHTTLPEGNTFALYPGKEFADCLTRYFKHGNVASFVRQLHMYGFHKVSDGNNNSTTTDKDVPPVWEFKHSSGKFKRGDESSLIYIKRRSSSNTARNNHNNHNHNHHIYADGQYHNHYQHPHLIAHPHAEYAIPYEQYYPPQPQPTYAQPFIYLQQPQQQIQQHQIQPFPYPPQQQQQQPQPLSQPEYAIQPMHHRIPAPTPIPVAIPQQEIYLVKHDPPSSLDSPASSYTPNLQFRKIWDDSSSNSRPRNASYFDPLASPGAGGAIAVGSGGGNFTIPRNSSVNSSYSTDSKQSYLPPPLATGINRSTSLVSPSTPDPGSVLPMAAPTIQQNQQQPPRSIPNDFHPTATKKPSFYSQTRPSLTDYSTTKSLPSIGSITSINSNASSVFSNKSSISSVTSLPPPPSAPTNSSLNKILTPTPTTRPPSTPLPQDNYSNAANANNTVSVYPRVRSLSPQSMLTKDNGDSPKQQMGVPQPQKHRSLTNSPLSKEKNSKVSVNSLLDDSKVL